MKKSLLCLWSALAIAASVGLAACGGGSTFTLGGAVAGLSADGLVLANGADTVAIPAGATSYNFPHSVSYGTTYNVTVKTPPPHLTCGVNPAYATGTAGTNLTNNIDVACGRTPHTLGGTISGLTVAGLILNNGSDVVAPAANATSFVFSLNVSDGSAYGVTINTQPPGLTCSVANGVGTMGEADLKNVTVTCVPN